MKRFLLLALVALTVCSCGKQVKDSPVSEAIAAELMKNINEPYKFKFHELKLVDSTNFATEFARRINVYEVQLTQNAARIEKYTKEAKYHNVEKVFQEYKRGQKILGELEAMREMMGDDTLKTAYYDYEFSGVAKLSKGRKKIFDKGFATVTPDVRVLTIAPDQASLHRATGIVIPGYQELLDSFKEPAPEAEE